MSKPQQIGARTVELVRLPAESELYRALVFCSRPPMAPFPTSTRSKDEVRDLALTQAIAPRIYGILREACETLRVAAEVELHQVRDLRPGEVNACIDYSDEPVILRMIGSVVTHLDDREICALIGHELGHYLAHGPTCEFAIKPYEAYLQHRDFRGDRERARKIASAFSRAGELTADRYALLACQDVHATVEMEMVSLTGVPFRSLGSDPQAFLEHCCATISSRAHTEAGGLWRFERESHPDVALRVYATSLFSRTDAYHSLTGRGPGDMKLDDVNKTLRELLLPEDALAIASTEPGSKGREDGAKEEGARSSEKRRRKRKMRARRDSCATSNTGSMGERIFASVESVGSAALKAAERVTQAAAAVLARSHGTRADVGDALVSNPNEDSDLERRFRDLERQEHERSNLQVPDELERRFQALEEEADDDVV